MLLPQLLLIITTSITLQQFILLSLPLQMPLFTTTITITAITIANHLR